MTGERRVTDGPLTAPPGRPCCLDVLLLCNAPGLDAGDLIQYGGGEILTHARIRLFDGREYDATWPRIRQTPPEAIAERRDGIGARVWMDEEEYGRALVAITVDLGQRYSLGTILWHGLRRYLGIDAAWLRRKEAWVCSGWAAHVVKEAIGLPPQDPSRYGPTELCLYMALLCSDTGGLRVGLWDLAANDGLMYARADVLAMVCDRGLHPSMMETTA